MRNWLLVCTILAVAVCPLRADEGSSLDDAVASYLAERDPVARLARGLDVATRDVDARRVADAIERGWRWRATAPTGELVTWKETTPDGSRHTVYAYAPPSYTPEKAWPLLVWLHGLANRPEDGGGESGAVRLRAEADRKGFLIVSPSTQSGSEWWGPNGVGLLGDALAEMKRRYRVDADRVCAAGLSDGGSGCLQLLAHDPWPYCCFLSFIGNPLTSRLYGGPTWAPTLATRPFWAVNCGKDRLFPSAEVGPFFMELREAGLDLTWIDEPELGHNWEVLEKRWDEAHAFWLAHPRDPAPRRVAWTSSRPDGEGRYGWVEILELDAQASHDPALGAAVEMQLPDLRKPRLGIRLSREFAGPGLLIVEVEADTPAARAGFKDQDVILSAGETAFAGPDDTPRLPAYLRGLKAKEGVFFVKRGEEEIELRARPEILEKDKPRRPQALGYDVFPGTIVAEVKDGNTVHVRTLGVRRFRLHLSPALVDLAKDVTVSLNGAGEPAFRGSLTGEAGTVLVQAIARGPGVVLPHATVEIEVP